jgi:hypothetical protein
MSRTIREQLARYFPTLRLLKTCMKPGMGSWDSHESDSFLRLSTLWVLSHDVCLNKRHSHHLCTILSPRHQDHTPCSVYHQAQAPRLPHGSPLTQPITALGSPRLKPSSNNLLSYNRIHHSTLDNMCDYTQREYSCGHFRWIASKWCKDYTLTHKRCQPNVTHFEYR